MKLPSPCGCQFPLDKGSIFHLESRTTDYDSRRTWDSGLDAGSTPARSTSIKIHPLLVLKSRADGFFTSKTSAAAILFCEVRKTQIGKDLVCRNLRFAILIRVIKLSIFRFLMAKKMLAFAYKAGAFFKYKC